MHSTMPGSRGISRKAAQSARLHMEIPASPGKQGSCTAPARCAAQGFELACLTPAGQSLHGAGCHGQGTGSWAYLIAAHQENEMRGMLLDPDDQPAIKEEAVTRQHNLFWPQTIVTTLF